MNKSIIRFSAEGQILTMAGHMFYASQTINYIEAEFSLKHNWLDYEAISAIWVTPYVSIETVIGPTRKCIVPHEVLSRKGKVSVNLVGTKIENNEVVERMTTYPVVAIIVDAASQISGGSTQPITPSQYEQFVASVQEAVSEIKDIESTVLNSNYTLTFFYSDGTSYTVGPIRGEQGPQGEPGVQGETGASGETGPEGPEGQQGIQGEQGDPGVGIVDISQAQDGVITITLSDDTEYEVEALQGEKGDTGDTGATGEAGFSPIASVSKSGSVTTITITDEIGTTTAEVYDGTAGLSDVEVDGVSVVVDGVAEIDLSGKVDASDLSEVATSGDYDDLSNKPTIPTKVSDLTNDSGYITGYTETDPTVPSWAKASSKPSYTFSEIGTTPTSISGYGITDAYTKTEVDGLVSGVLHYKGTKATTSALPSSGNVTGDVWHVTADGSEWAWDGTQWQELGTAVDLSGYVPTSRTVNGHALTGNITLTASDVSALPSSTTIPTITDTYSGTSSNGMSGKAVKSAIDALDGTVTGSAGSGKTLTAFSQTDGKVTATFGSISITKSQVSDFPTIPTKVSDLTNDSGFLTLSTLPIYQGVVQ